MDKAKLGWPRIVSRTLLFAGLLAGGSAFAGCDEGPRLVQKDRAETPVEDRGPQSVSVREVWKTNIDPQFDNNVSGMASWPDGSIWVGHSRTTEIWELQSDGSRPATVEWNASESGIDDTIQRVSIVNDTLFFVLGRISIAIGTRRQPATVRRVELFPYWQWGFAGAPDGSFIISGGTDPSDDYFDHSVHLFDEHGARVDSWHSVFPHDDWRATRRLSGGALDFTASGDLLVSDVAPFRITKYVDSDPGQPSLVVEDEGIISSTERTRATAPDEPTTTYQVRWNRSTFVAEMQDGNILNVSHHYGRWRGRPYSLWTVVTPDGEILASTRYENNYRVWNRAPDGTYLASQDGNAIKLAVLLEPIASP